MEQGRWTKARIRFYSGGRAEETPRAFAAGGLEAGNLTLVTESREYSPGEGVYRLFRVRDERGDLFTLRKREPDGEWEIATEEMRRRDDD